jgi:hypothetical protein
MINHTSFLRGDNGSEGKLRIGVLFFSLREGFTIGAETFFTANVKVVDALVKLVESMVLILRGRHLEGYEVE